MDPARWERIQRIFHESLAQPEERRRDFVKSACASAPDIEEEVLALLAEDRSGGSLLNRGVGEAAEAIFDGSTAVPETIGAAEELQAHTFGDFGGDQHRGSEPGMHRGDRGLRPRSLRQHGG